MIFDLHSHSAFSDGALTPQELVSRAIGQGVGVLAITDHDTLDAYREPLAPGGNFRLVPGIELSTRWGTASVHVLGLNIDPASDAIRAAARFQAGARLRRARQIGEKLASRGIQNAYEGARGLAEGSYVGRPNFARYIVSTGKAASVQSAFNKYLGDGRLGDVRHHWAGLRQVIEWVRGAGGIPVLAHPLKYRLTRSKLKRLVDEFRQAGGQAIEVVSGWQARQQTRDLAQLCAQMKLLASCGSDFHGPGSPRAELGAFESLPGTVMPVWERF